MQRVQRKCIVCSCVHHRQQKASWFCADCGENAVLCWPCTGCACYQYHNENGLLQWLGWAWASPMLASWLREITLSSVVRTSSKSQKFLQFSLNVSHNTCSLFFKDRERLARATETAEEQETRLAWWTERDRARTDEERETRLARQRLQDKARTAQLRGKILYLPNRENKTGRRAQETADHVLCTHSHIVVPHDDVYQSQYTFSFRLAPQSSRNSWSCFAYSFPHCSASWWRLPVSIHILAQTRPTNVSHSLVYNMLGDTDETCMRACTCEYCSLPPCTVHCPVLLYFCLSAIRWKSHSSKSYQKNEYCWW